MFFALVSYCVDYMYTFFLTNFHWKQVCFMIVVCTVNIYKEWSIFLSITILPQRTPTFSLLWHIHILTHHPWGALLIRKCWHTDACLLLFLLIFSSFGWQHLAGLSYFALPDRCHQHAVQLVVVVLHCLIVHLYKERN